MITNVHRVFYVIAANVETNVTVEKNPFNFTGQKSLPVAIYIPMYFFQYKFGFLN